MELLEWVYGSNRHSKKMSKSDSKRKKSPSDIHFPITLRPSTGDRPSHGLIGPRNHPDSHKIEPAPPAAQREQAQSLVRYEPQESRPDEHNTEGLSVGELICTLQSKIRQQEGELAILKPLGAENRKLAHDLHDLHQTCQRLNQEANETMDLRQDLEREQGFLWQERIRVKSLSSQLNDLDGKLQAEKRTAGSLRSRICTLEGQVDLLTQRKQKLENEVSRLSQGNEGLENDLEKLRNTEQIQAEQIKTYKRAVKDLEKELEDARKTHDIQAENVRKAQESAFQLLDQAQWLPEADSDISRKLNLLHSSITNWCKTYALKSAVDYAALCDEDQSRVEDVLFHISPSVDSLSLINWIDPAIGAKWPNILLSATLAHAIYTTIFNDPFFFDNAIRSSGFSEDRETRGVVSHISRTYLDLIKADKKSGNSWRAQTLRLLDPQTPRNQAGQEGIMQLKTATQSFRVSAAVQFTQDFLNGSSKVFLNPNFADPGQRQLEKIVAQAADISYKLWTQKMQMQSLTLEDLPKKKGTVRFSSRSDLLEHHNLHNLQLNDNETCLDGKEIVLVTHPAIVAYGNAEGTDYSTRRVWKKAVVWMGN